MQASLCAMSIALKQIEGDDSLLVAATQQLALAVRAANRYHRLNNSVYWKTAKPTFKRGVRKALNFLAYDVFSAFLEAASCLKRYSEIHRARSAPPAWWNETAISLTMAYDALQKEHGTEINARQMFLIPDERCTG